MFDRVPDAAVVGAIGDSARAENIACARRLAAIAELYERRHIPVEDGKGRELWRIDPWEAVAAEVAAAQGITAAAAGAQLHNAICLHARLPKVAALFATGAISYRTVRMIVARTFLALEPEVLAAIDAELAETLTTWGALSFAKTEQAIDALVERHDPAARRRTETAIRSRHVDISHSGGIASIAGDLYSTDATLLDRRLTALAHTVCGHDPRTIDQRRADALGALAAGHTTLACACGMADCPAETPSGTSVVVHVVAEAAALDAAETADLNGERPGDGGPEIVRDPERLAELIREASTPRPGTARDYPQPRRGAGRADHARRGTGRLGSPGHSRAATADPSWPEPTRTALPTVTGTGRLRTLPRPHLPLPQLRPTSRRMRHRPHRSIRCRWSYGCLESEVSMPKTSLAQDFLERRHRLAR
jgi:hypothetical protein